MKKVKLSAFGILFLVLILGIPPKVWSQDFQSVDSIVHTYPKSFGNTKRLANKVNSDFDTKIEKVRAIYSWIANAIEYDPNESDKFNYSYYDEEDRKKKEASYQKKLSTRVISQGKAVCEGYAVLFHTLCSLMNINSKVVNGSSKTTVSDIGKRYYSDHAWNIVWLDDIPYLVDVTWGAGSYSNYFRRDVDYFYFLTPPELFILNHYPDDYKNSLLKTRISKKAFLEAPVICQNRLDDLKIVSPKGGILSKKKKIIKFVFKTEEKINHVEYDFGRKEYGKINFKQLDDKIEFKIAIADPRAKELNIWIDSQLFVMYKLN